MMADSLCHHTSQMTLAYQVLKSDVNMVTCQAQVEVQSDPRQQLWMQ